MKTPVSRRSFFWTLTLSYLLITVVVLFFAFGYRFSFERSIFIYSGSLTIKSNPKTTVVSIDGDDTKGLRNIINNSYHITGFRPGDHVITVAQGGFQSWNKKVNFTSGRSTEFWNVLLARHFYERETYETPAIAKYYLAPKDKLAAVVEKTDHLKVSILDRKEKTSTDLLEVSDVTFTTDDMQNIEWSPEARSLIIPIEQMRSDQETDTTTTSDNATTQNNTPNDTSEQEESQNEEPLKDHLIINRKTNETIMLSELIPDDLPLSTVRWDPRKKDILFYISQNTLYRLPLETPEDKIMIAQDIRAYDFTDDGLYYITANNDLMRTSFDDPNDAKELTDLDLSEARDVTRMIAYDKHRLVLFTEDGSFFFYNDGDEDETFEKIGDRIIGAHFSNDGKKLLYWSNNELFTHFTRKWETQPIRTENEHTDIARFSQNIENVHWAKTFEHIIFTLDNEIKVIELDHRDRRNMHTIMQLKSDDTQVVSNFADDELYLIDQDNDIPTLFSITFPEDEGFL